MSQNHIAEQATILVYVLADWLTSIKCYIGISEYMLHVLVIIINKVVPGDVFNAALLRKLWLEWSDDIWIKYFIH